MTVFLRIVAIIADIALIGIIGYFLSPLRWSEESDRPSIIGFWYMLITLVLNTLLLVLYA